MEASEMTNEELANKLDDVLVNDELQTFEDVDRQVEALREAAARLRNVTIRSDNSKVIAELQRRLKVAEDALEAIFGKVAYKGFISPVNKAEAALSAIREETETKGETK